METEDIIDKFLPESKKKWIIIYATWKITKKHTNETFIVPSAMTCILKVNESVFLQFSKFSYKKIHKSVAMSGSDQMPKKYLNEPTNTRKDFNGIEWIIIYD